MALLSILTFNPAEAAQGKEKGTADPWNVTARPGLYREQYF